MSTEPGAGENRAGGEQAKRVVSPPVEWARLGVDEFWLNRAGVIDRDLPCDSCGYNLRTLDTAALCPECGCATESLEKEECQMGP
ncbi:MAG: hypothetical protein AB1716_10290 [Planctomycetota bacterium]